VVAGTVDTDVADRATHVSLLQEFGAEAAWEDPLRCVAEAVERWLRREWAIPVTRGALPLRDH
jgi:hypothetical protein